MKRLLTAGIALLLSASNAFAQPGAPPLPAPEALQWMCHADGAGEFKFGQVAVPGSTALEGGLFSGLELPESTRHFTQPFTVASPNATKWSNRLDEVYFSAASPDDRRLADAQVEAIGNALERMGWASIPSLVVGPNEPIHARAYSEGRLFERPVDGVAGRTRLLLNVRHSHGELVIICGREDLLRVDDEEIVGHLAPGTPRPLMPELDIPQVGGPADCKQPEILASIAHLVALGTDGRSMVVADRHVMAMMVARTSYWDRLSEWMLWKIEESDKLSPDKFRALREKAAIPEQSGLDFYYQIGRASCRERV